MFLIHWYTCIRIGQMELFVYASVAMQEAFFNLELKWRMWLLAGVVVAARVHDRNL